MKLLYGLGMLAALVLAAAGLWRLFWVSPSLAEEWEVNLGFFALATAAIVALVIGNLELHDRITVLEKRGQEPK